MAHRASDDLTGPSILTATFWADSIERIANSAGVGALAAMPAAVPYTHGIDVRAVAWGFGLGALYEFFRCLAAAGKGNPGTASFIRATKAGATPNITRFMGRGE